MWRYISFVVLFSCAVTCARAHRAPAHGDKKPLSCGPNEIEDCVFSCPPERSCKNRDLNVNCLDVIEPCTNTCVCKPGYIRNYLGDCIPEHRCDECSGGNEFFSCGSACDNECATLFKQNRTSCPIQNIVCNPKCYCEDGFARDNKGKCIPREQCPPTPACGQNEEYTDDKRSCPPETCISIAAFFKCDSHQPTERGCVCKPGFLRKSHDSPCVPLCECPQMQNAPECHKGRY